jgi:hypothetical protein
MRAQIRSRRETAQRGTFEKPGGSGRGRGPLKRGGVWRETNNKS